jgi:hypothetical protein
LNTHVEVVFDIVEYEQLKAEASRQGQPVAELIRLAVRRLYIDQQEHKRKEALDWLLSRSDELGTWEETKPLLEDMHIEGHEAFTDEVT